jgi:hypothetical protein
MTDNNQDRSQDQDQQGIDRETEQRNRENETGQKQDQQPGQERQDAGFVGSDQDNSSDYLTKGEENQDFAAESQGAQDTSAGRSDIETGQSQGRDPSLEEGSDSDI